MTDLILVCQCSSIQLKTSGEEKCCYFLNFTFKKLFISSVLQYHL